VVSIIPHDFDLISICSTAASADAKDEAEEETWQSQQQRLSREYFGE
jgi:hypothetical protein